MNVFSTGMREEDGWADKGRGWAGTQEKMMGRHTGEEDMGMQMRDILGDREHFD